MRGQLSFISLSRRYGGERKKLYFLKQTKKKCLERSETKEYTKIFCKNFGRVSVKNLDIFIIFSWIIETTQIHLCIIPFAFLVSKTYIFIHVKKICIKSKNVIFLTCSLCDSLTISFIALFRLSM